MAQALANFAKIHPVLGGQVLVFLDENKEGLPAICVAAQIANGGPQVKMHIGGWNDDAEGWAKAESALDKFNADEAHNFIAKVLPSLIGGAA